MSSIVLCIFEGLRSEQVIANNLFVHFLTETDKVILRASYGFNLYKLYQEISKDEFFDTYEIICEQLRARSGSLRPEESQVLDIDDPEKISDIYLFFDYDCHCSNANDQKLESMLSTFDDPQERGLLCVSYPMLEAIRHQESNRFKETRHSTSDLQGYKRWITNCTELDRRYRNWGLFDLIIWSEIIVQHLARANKLVNEQLCLPDSPLLQIEIFIKQLEKHLPSNEIAVLSAFPLMLFDYYGSHLFKLLETQISEN